MIATKADTPTKPAMIERSITGTPAAVIERSITSHSPRVILTGGEVWRGTFAEFLADNGDSFTAEEIRQMAGCVGRGESYTFGGGAAPVFTLRRELAPLPTVAQARTYMQQLGSGRCVNGYVIFFEGAACGWSARPEPKSWRPGSVAVDLKTGGQFLAIDGDELNGCDRWELVGMSS